MSTEARDVIARAIVAEASGDPHATLNGAVWAVCEADAVLAALEAAGLTIVPRTAEWEWGHRPGPDAEWATNESGVIRSPNEAHARRTKHDECDIVRRRPAGEWEVAT